MTTYARISLWMAIGANAGLLAFTIQMGGILQFPLMLVAVIYPALAVVALIHAIRSWKSLGWKSVLPLGIVLLGGLSLELSIRVGIGIRDTLFWRNLPKYQQVVRRVETGDIPLTNAIQKLELSRKETPRCYAVFAGKELDGHTTVEFLIGAGFPVKHSGYLYYSGEHIEKGSELRRRWPRGRKMTDHWFQVGD